MEKSGLFKFITKTYGDHAFGAEECFIGITDWGNGIIYNKDKTFFPSSWSKEKTAQVIFEANKNRIKILDDTPSRKQFECKGPNDLIIEIVIDSKNTIISAYPSLNNFIGLS